MRKRELQSFFYFIRYLFTWQRLSLGESRGRELKRLTAHSHHTRERLVKREERGERWRRRGAEAGKPNEDRGGVTFCPNDDLTSPYILREDGAILGLRRRGKTKTLGQDLGAFIRGQHYGRTRQSYSATSPHSPAVTVCAEGCLDTVNVFVSWLVWETSPAYYKTTECLSSKSVGPGHDIGERYCGNRVRRAALLNRGIRPLVYGSSPSVDDLCAEDDAGNSRSINLSLSRTESS